MDQKKQTKIISFLKRRETRKKAKKELPKIQLLLRLLLHTPCSRWLCAKRPKIWQKNVNEIVITLKNKTSTENLSARTRPSLLCPLAVAKGCGRCDTKKKINLLNTSASARSSLRAKQRGRAACVYPAKFSKKTLWLWYFPICKTGLKSPYILYYPVPTQESYTLLTAAKLLKNYYCWVWCERDCWDYRFKESFFSMSSANWMWWDLCFEPWIAQNVSCRAYALSLWACDVILNYLCVVCWEERAWWVSTTDYTWLNKEEQYWKDACRLPFCATTFTKFIHSFWFKIRKILLPMKKMNISQF